MTGLDNYNDRMKGKGHTMHRKFSEIPDGNNWKNKTFDFGQERRSHISQPNNILSFKKEGSNEQDLHGQYHWSQYQNGKNNGLRAVQSNLSHMLPSPKMVPNYDSQIQRSKEFHSMQQLPMPYMQIPMKRTSIDMDNVQGSGGKNYGQFPNQNNPSYSQRDLLNMSHIAPSVIMNPEPRSFSEEDMEHRLTLLFRKMLVFSSKIDTLKDKIISNNPDFSSYRLFVKFSGEKKTRMDVIGLMDFFHAFNFDFGSNFVEKVMIFLSKYQLDGQSSYAEGIGDEEGYEAHFENYGTLDSR
jgi:hypothetical protein